jgi:hypothetical protein
MDFDVYCDESRPDLFCSKNPDAKFLVIGSLWIPTELRGEFKAAIHLLRKEFGIRGEAKWTKVSPMTEEFYLALVQWFLDQGPQIRFRCIAVDHTQANLLKYHDKDQELAFYKFYYQLLHHWILDFNSYSIFCDLKANRRPDRLSVLRRCLDNSNLSSMVPNVQATRSRESVLLQLVDVLTGAASGKLNGMIRENGSKSRIVSLIETRLGHPIRHTPPFEQKFNVFVVNLKGGW